jgi:hypothetical protein
MSVSNACPINGRAQGETYSCQRPTSGRWCALRTAPTHGRARLLKQLKAAGKRGRGISALNCSAAGLVRLLAAGYVIDKASEGLDLVLYRITDAGKKELLNVTSL